MTTKGPHYYFWQGFVCHLGLVMTYQDWLGLDRYVISVQQNWVNLHWSVGFAIMAFCIATHLTARRLEGRQRDN